MRNFATLFDSRYLPQGLALYESLQKHSSEPFALHVLAMDDECYQTMKQLRLPNVKIKGLLSFEWDMELIGIRENRTWQEYCWSCASQLCEYLLRDRGEGELLLPGLKEVTYLDADLYAFADMEPVFDEIGSRSVAITPHQFPDNSEKPRLQKSGIYNVGFIHFKNTEAGRACLSQWAAQVRNRCSEEVGCGDQCYLDFFERDFGKEVCILGHGVNTGPWNLMAYDVTERDGQVYLGGDVLRCYHAHEYKHGERLTNYPLREVDRQLIYSPYAVAVENAKQRIESLRQLA